MMATAGEGAEARSTLGLPPEGGKRGKVVWVIQRGSGKYGYEDDREGGEAG